MMFGYHIFDNLFKNIKNHIIICSLYCLDAIVLDGAVIVQLLTPLSISI